MNTNLFGLNPKFKDFIEKYPDKTVLGVSWALQWRLMLLILVIEFGILIVVGLIAFIFVALFN